MKSLHKFLLACLSLGALAACGGGDTEDRLDIADPKVRFVQVSAVAPNVTLYRAGTAQSDATNVAYRFASNYFDVGTGVADWSVKTAAGSTTLGSVSIDPQRGTRYTIVTFPASSSASSVSLIADPYNKPLTSDSTRLRVMNAAFNASNIDVYMNGIGTDISAAGVNPRIAATAYGNAGPVSGTDSVDLPAGTYQVTITAAGSKTALFRGQVSFGANQDLLLFAVPNAPVPTGIKALLKVEGTAGVSDVPTI